MASQVYVRGQLKVLATVFIAAVNFACKFRQLRTRCNLVRVALGAISGIQPAVIRGAVPGVRGCRLRVLPLPQQQIRRRKYS